MPRKRTWVQYKLPQEWRLRVPRLLQHMFWLGNWTSAPNNSTSFPRSSFWVCLVLGAPPTQTNKTGGFLICFLVVFLFVLSRPPEKGYPETKAQPGSRGDSRVLPTHLGAPSFLLQLPLHLLREPTQKQSEQYKKTSKNNPMSKHQKTTSKHKQEQAVEVADQPTKH